MANLQGGTSMRNMSAPDFANLRYNFSGIHEASLFVVPCNVAHNQPEVWRQCVGTPENSRAW